METIFGGISQKVIVPVVIHKGKGTISNVLNYLNALKLKTWLVSKKWPVTAVGYSVYQNNITISISLHTTSDKFDKYEKAQFLNKLAQFFASHDGTDDFVIEHKEMRFDGLKKTPLKQSDPKNIIFFFNNSTNNQTMFVSPAKMLVNAFQNYKAPAKPSPGMPSRKIPAKASRKTPTKGSRKSATKTSRAAKKAANNKIQYLSEPFIDRNDPDY